MIKLLQRFFALVLLLATLLPQSVLAASVFDNTSGYILLQVQEAGEAWYVNPTDHLRYYMKDGSTAYEMMRSFGLGITNADLNNIPAVESVDEMKSAKSICATNSFSRKVQGRILLQVQAHGEAWYVYPAKCYRIYMKDGDAAYQIMRFLGLGITNTDLQQLDFGVIKVAEQPVVEQPVNEEKPVEALPAPVVPEPAPTAPAPVPVTGDFSGVNLNTVVLLKCGENDAVNYVIGSGTLVSANGKIITNAHVLGTNPSMSRCAVWIQKHDEVYYADVQEVWTDTDVATLRITGVFVNDEVRVLAPGEITFDFVGSVCKAEDLNFGDRLWIVGYPAVGGFTLNVTDGIISGALGAYIKTSAKIEHGNSGGAAFHESGCWVGIPTFSSVGEIESIGFILAPSLMADPFI